MRNDNLYLKKLKAPEVTTSMLLAALAEYENPQKKIHDLNKKGLIKPVKQGVYLISGDVGLRPYSKEILANLIYGPSYISLETALSFYGFIPERVTSTTSICLGRGKSFSTSVGEFKYHHIKDSLYPLGVALKEAAKGAYCQYATPEKALLDFLYLKETKDAFGNQKDYFKFIIDSYRFDLKAIKIKTSSKKLLSFAEQYSREHINWFVSELKRTLKK